MNLKKNLRRRAFTLVEIMVAIMIFSLMVGAIYSTWMIVLRSAKVGQDVAAQIQRQRVAVRTIENSLSCIQSFQSSPQYYTFIMQNGDQPMLSFTARLPDIFPRNGKFGDFNVRRLTFTIEPGTDQEKNLVLRQNPILMDVDPDEQNYPLILARNVKDFTVEAWDTNAMDWTDEWDDTNSIPPMLRVTLTTGGNTDVQNPGPELSVTRAIAIPSSMLPSVIQTPRIGGGVGGGVNFNRGNFRGGGGNGNPNGGNPAFNQGGQGFNPGRPPNQ